MLKQALNQRIRSHLMLIISAMIIIFPVYIAFVASTHSVQELLQAPIPIWIGHHFWHNYSVVLGQGIEAAGGIPVKIMLLNSLIMALAIAIGKILISLLSAYAIVYYRFRFRMLAFWLIFITLMLPVEVRILPSFEIAARLNLLNTHVGLTLPLMASATATFLFRQFFMTIPNELVEAARIDGASSWQFFRIFCFLYQKQILPLFLLFNLFMAGINIYGRSSLQRDQICIP